MSDHRLIDRAAEAERITRDVAALTPDPAIALRLFRGARRTAARQWLRSPNWYFATALFGVGSTYAWAICERIGVDPDAHTAEPAR